VRTKLVFSTRRLDFQTDLKNRVDAYFARTGETRNANAAMYAKIAFWVGFTISSWLLVVTNAYAVAGAFAPLAFIGCCMLVGFGLAAIGFNVGHDAIHGSLSEKKWVNNALSWSFDVMGASSYNWSIAHNFVHHTYTNIPGVDKDLENGGFIRLQPEAPRAAAHRYQHWYAWVLYGVTSLVWLLTKDFEQMAIPDPRTGKPIPGREKAKIFVGKALHLTLFVALPALLVSLPWYWLVAGYLAMHAVAGFTLAVVFQLAHVVEDVQFPAAPLSGSVIDDPWAEHQLRTTANFGNTWLATFICGGLDHQIEHHLLPRVCHIHYRSLAPIVAQCARDHGLPYIHNGSFFDAVGSHGRVLKELGSSDPREASMPLARAA
jgi:linoleoyl-CoA desaturase